MPEIDPSVLARRVRRALAGLALTLTLLLGGCDTSQLAAPAGVASPTAGSPVAASPAAASPSAVARAGAPAASPTAAGAVAAASPIPAVAVPVATAAAVTRPVPTPVFAARAASPSPSPLPALAASPVVQLSPAASLFTTVATVERVGGRDLGLTVESPAGFNRSGTEYRWTSPASPTRRLGIDWTDITPGWQPSALLPNHSRVLRSEPVELAWGKGTRYTLERTGTAAQGGGVEAVETHFVIQVGGKRAYDFYAVGRNEQELLAVEPLLQRLLNSALPAAG